MNVLVFVKDKKVIAYTEHTRDKGDFSNLSGQCFARHKASFEFIAKPAIGWPGLFPKPQ